MPPEQCPECGRFLSNAFVTGLAAADAPCPKCETTLVAAMFSVAETDVAEVEPAVPTSGAVRPPDLEPQASGATVRPPDQSHLAGWDTGGAPVTTIDPSEHRGFDPVVFGVLTAGGALAGLGLGGLLASKRRGLGATFGVIVGAAAGAVTAQLSADRTR